MTRRKYSREFKIEAVKLVTERGVSIAQAARDLDLVDLGFAPMGERARRRAYQRVSWQWIANRAEQAEIAALKKD